MSLDYAYNLEIKLNKQKLDLIEKIERMVEENATGYDLLYECELFDKALDKQFDQFYNYREENPVLKNIQIFPSPLIGGLMSVIKRFGSQKVRDAKADRDYPYLLKRLKSERQKTLNTIGFLEFKKKKIPSETSEDLVKDDREIDDFTKFLDEKYDEWKDSKI